MQTIEELGDVYNHFLLYYGRDIPKMQNAAKASKKRLKKIKEVSEDGKCLTGSFFFWIPFVLVVLNFIGSLAGEEEEIEVEQEEEQKGPDLKLASRRDMYSICQSVGLG